MIVARCNQRGYISVIVAVALIALAAMALLLANTTSMDNALLAKQVEDNTLNYVLEAGLAHVRWQLAQNSTCDNYTDLASTSFGSHQYSASIAPGSGSPIDLTVDAALGNGLTRSRTVSTPVYASPALLVLQPGTSLEDAYTWAGAHEGKNFGAAAILSVNNASAERTSLLKFDLSGIPPGSTIQSASLELYLQSGNGLTDGVLDIHRMTQSWVEGIYDDQSPPAGGGTTYQSYDGQTNWANPGGDFDATIIDSVTIPSMTPGWYSWDVRSAVESWVQGFQINHGLLLRASAGTADKIEFASGDNVTSAISPRLTISYSCVCGQACSVPTVGKVLMVVGDPDNIDANEAIRKSLIESWGYVVSTIDDSDSQASFDIEIADQDVAYVPALVSDSALDTKLSNVTQGVVIEVPDLLQEFGFSQDRNLKDRDVIDIVDNSHYITSTFPTGLLTIYSGLEPSYLVMPNLAPGLEVLGEMNNTGSGWSSALTALASGAPLYGGGTAAGRRVNLPWENLDFSSLNADGQTIMRRALEWASNTGPELAPFAHWKLDDGVGTEAVDSVGGHTGTLENGPTWTVPGAVGGALDFDGTNDRIVVPHADTLSISTALTMSAWVKNDTTMSGSYRILSKETNGQNDSYWLSVQGTQLWMGIGGSLFSPGIPLMQDTWHHVAATFDDDTDEVRMYIDGMELLVQSTTATLTANNAPLYLGTNWEGKYWSGLLDDIRLYDRTLSTEEIAELANTGASGGGGGGVYIEKNEVWYPSQENQWELEDMSPYGVPSNAVAEIAIINSHTSREREGGLRYAASSEDRKLKLHEAEGGGEEVVVMHVLTDKSSHIEYWVEDSSDVYFVLLGYWNTGSYEENWQQFQALGNATWADYKLSDAGTGPNQVAEIVITNRNSSAERPAGVRPLGSADDRYLQIHEAESGGVDAATMLVQTDNTSRASIQVYAQNNSDIRFYAAGHWVVAPGTFTSTISGPFDPNSPSDSWTDWNLTSLGVPPDAVVVVAIINRDSNQESWLGVREKGPIQRDRVFELQEAESGGGDIVVLHVNADANSTIQWYDEFASDQHQFIVLGWWEPSP